MMHIGVVTHKVSKGDGQGRVNYETVVRLLELGHSVTLIATSIAPELESHPNVQWAEISVRGVPIALFQTQLFAYRSAQWLRKYGDQIDVLHSNGCITWAKSDINAAHFVHSAWLKSPVHTSRVRRDIYGAYQYLYTRLNSAWEKTAYRSARAVVAVSEQVRRELMAIGVDKERIHVVLNGVDLVEFHPGLEIRSALGLPEDVTCALFVGDIRTPRKNLDTVLRSLVHAPELHLAIVGKTDGSPYPALARELGVDQRTHFLGFRTDVARLMRACDIFAFPSRYEACSLVLLEALASGMPIVTAATAGGSEIVTNECGFVLEDPNDADILASTLTALHANPVLRKQMGAASRAVAEAHSWRTMADDYIRLYAGCSVADAPEGVATGGPSMA